MTCSHSKNNTFAICCCAFSGSFSFSVKYYGLTRGNYVGIQSWLINFLPEIRSCLPSPLYLSAKTYFKTLFKLFIRMLAQRFVTLPLNCIDKIHIALAVPCQGMEDGWRVSSPYASVKQYGILAS